MAYCPHCGANVHDEAVLCVHCGRTIKDMKQPVGSGVRDEGGFLWGLLGFMIPVAGLIIYLLWKEDHPLNAKAAGVGALVNVGIGLSFFVIYILFIFITLGFAFQA